MKNRKLDVDICVLGAGPAGTTAARKLSLLGFKVVLLEKHSFPRPHVGESLSQGIYTVFNLLGITPNQVNGTLKKAKSRVRWSSNLNQPSTPKDDFVVDRASFDQYLLDIAEKSGVRSFLPAKALRPFLNKEQRWQIPFNYNKEDFIVSADVLVDATGRTSVLPTKKKLSSIQTLALYGNWKNSSLLNYDTLIEAGKNQWYWAANLPNGNTNIMVFVNPKSIKSHSKEALCNSYLSLIVESTELSTMSVRNLLDFNCCNATSYYATQVATSTYVKVGEAACAIDPLSSQGVQVSMMTAYQGSIAINTILRKPEQKKVAIEFYENKINDTVRRNQQWAANIYARQNLFPNTDFWKTRGSLLVKIEKGEQKSPETADILSIEKCIFNKSPLAIKVSVPVIRNNFIEYKSAISHPSLRTPLAYLGSLDASCLFDKINDGDDLTSILSKWRNVIPMDDSIKVIGWLLKNQLLVSNLN